MTLEEFFAKNKKTAIGFSGGVDSAYLLYAAKKCGADIQPYYIKTAFQPDFEYNDALQVCSDLGIQLKTVEYDILSNSAVASNPKNRCYYCKKAMFTLLKSQAEADGYSVIIDGTNASDDLQERAGAKAIEELGVRSPLRECGLTKDKIRTLSKEAGLFTWDKPSYSCLATRVQTGKMITDDLLKHIDASEKAMRLMGFADFRVRVYNGDARLQIKEAQFNLAVNKRDEILKYITPYFKTVLLDMQAR